jgi:hypothetical protein
MQGSQNADFLSPNMTCKGWNICRHTAELVSTTVGSSSRLGQGNDLIRRKPIQIWLVVTYSKWPSFRSQFPNNAISHPRKLDSMTLNASCFHSSSHLLSCSACICYHAPTMILIKKVSISEWYSISKHHLITSSIRRINKCRICTCQYWCTCCGWESR